MHTLTYSLAYTHARARMRARSLRYGRLVFHNASTVTFTQFNNEKGEIFDEFIITADSHGAFS